MKFDPFISIFFLSMLQELSRKTGSIPFCSEQQMPSSGGKGTVISKLSVHVLECERSCKPRRVMCGRGEERGRVEERGQV